MPAPKKSAAKIEKRKSFSRRMRTAYHEAGHAVLSAAICDSPSHVSIRQIGASFGRSGQKMIGRHKVLVQVYLAGYAAEHLLTGHRPRPFARQVGFAMLASDPQFATLKDDCGGTDEFGAVQEILAMGSDLDFDAIRREVDRFYVAATESLSAIWPAVQGVAKALIRHEELDKDGVWEAFGSIDIYIPVFAVQRKHGLLADMGLTKPKAEKKRAAKSRRA